MKRNNPSFVPYEGKRPYIFISYSHKDPGVIDDLEKLSKLGFRIWYDAGILTGAKWSRSIDEHLMACSAFMIFVSKHAVQSDYVLEELGTARDRKIPIVPIFLSKDADPGIEYKVLRRRQGIERWDKSGNDYYYDLCKKLQEVAFRTREDPYERDSKNLGIGYLPTLKDILKGTTSLAPEEQEKRRNEFVLGMRDAKPPIRKYPIDSVFQITSEVTHALNNLEELEPSKTDSGKPSNLLSLPLDIGQVYVAPLRLVTGLITRLDENWPPLVTSYSKLVKQHEMNRLEDLHYYIEFCWLAWGPSVLTTSLFAQKREFMVVQAAFGDEANSIPLIMKKDKWGLIKRKLGERSYSGWPTCLKNVLVVKPGVDDFFKEVRNYPLFKGVFSDKRQVALYLPHKDKRWADGDIETGTCGEYAFYSTAYVWVMLEQIEQDEVKSQSIRHYKMKPGKIIPFFEHANLATSKGLGFLQHCLARKAIYHVLDCESDPDYRDKGYYRFATALFPEQMVEILGEEISRLNTKDHTKDQDTLQKRFKISKKPKDWRTPEEVVEFADAVDAAIKKCCKALT